MSGELDETRSSDTPPAQRRHGAPGAGPAKVGPFRVLGRLGAGGMGEVYEALDERLGRRVALKRLHPDRAADPESRARLEREARAVAALSHPGIVTLLSIEEQDGALHLAFERVQGRTLAEMLQSGPLPLPDVLDFGAQLCDAVSAAHAAGIVHRDIKPSNVMVTTDRRVKVLDFGIARRDPAAGGTAGPRVTWEGEVLGTPAYMSPEQLTGASADCRSDAWALGCTLFEMTTGRRPFEATTAPGLVQAILGATPPSLLLLRPDAPDRLAALVGSCLRRPADERPAHAGVLRDELRSLAAPATATSPGLPAERDEFIGRRAELETLTSRLEEARLVTVLGIGGSGKTRLALRAARALGPGLRGGAWFCDLSEARDAPGLVAAVARGLDVPLGKADPVVQLGHAIASRGRCLVVFDNFEQVARHAAETLGRWMDQCPAASFLVTSREVLGLQGEHVLALPPLGEEEALTLFLERGRSARQDFAPTGEELAACREVVRLLDLLPLSIELAAARVRVLPPSGILARLSDRFSLLSGAGRRKDRQGTLRATLDWSWDLLSPAERGALAQLSVFAGGFTVEQAEAVARLDGEQAVPVLDAVQALVDKSLLRHGADGRFELLVTVQEYAAERLRSDASLGGSEAAEARHGAHMAAMGAADPGLAPSRHADIARRRALAASLDNLRVACRRAIARRDAAAAVGSLRGAADVLEMRGPFSAMAELAQGVLAIPTLDDEQRSRAATVLGSACWRMGRLAEAQELTSSALELHRARGDRRAEVLALNTLGMVAMEQGRLEEAEARLEQALAVLAAQPHDRARGITLLNLAALEHFRGNVDRAERHAMEALAACRAAGDVRAEAVSLANLGAALSARGDRGGAARRFEEALLLHEQTGDRRSRCVALVNLANAVGEPDRRRDLLQEALSLARGGGDQRNVALVSMNLAGVMLAEGRRAEAEALLQGALDIHRTGGNRRAEGATLAHLGLLRAHDGGLDDALRLVREAEAILSDAGARLDLAHAIACRAEIEWRLGDPAASATLVSAESLLREAGAGAESEPGQECERVRRLLASG